MAESIVRDKKGDFLKTEVKVTDIKKYLEEKAWKVSWEKFQEIFNNKKGKNWEKDSEYWRGRCDSYLDLRYMILGKNDDREELRLDRSKH